VVGEQNRPPPFLPLLFRFDCFLHKRVFSLFEYDVALSKFVKT